MLCEWRRGEGDPMRGGERSPRAVEAIWDVGGNFAAVGEMRDVAGGDLRLGREPLEPVGLGCDIICCALTPVNT